MRRHPFYNSHPEFSVLEGNGFCEYRVGNCRLSYESGHGILQGDPIFTQRDAGWLAVPITMCYLIQDIRILISALVFTLIHLWLKYNQVLYESIIVIPPHGIQLETHRGYPGLHVFITRRFIRFNGFQDVVIHEGLKGWDVRFFIAVINISSSGNIILDIAYRNLHPQQNVLLYVYRSMHNHLLQPIG